MLTWNRILMIISLLILQADMNITATMAVTLQVSWQYDINSLINFYYVDR